MSKITQEELDGLRALCEAIPAIYTCTEGFNCKWQGFGMLRGVGAGLIANTTPEWRERHEQQCPGQLIQVTPNDAMPRLLDALAAAQEENKRLREGLVVSAVGIMEMRECAQCIYPYTADDGVEETGDCGNWPTCPETCPLAQLLRLAGIEPQQDGGTDKARALLGEEAGDE